MHEVTDFSEGRSAKVLYSLGSVLSFSIVYTNARHPLPPSDLPVPAIVLVVLVSTVILTLSWWIGSRLSREYKDDQQARRDRRAAMVLASVRHQITTDFSLYLRGFETTGRMPHEASGQMLSPGFDPRDPSDAVMDMETGLAEAVEKNFPLVALGRPGEHVGAGRALSTEEGWKADIAALGKKAAVIFMIPSARPGSLWELDWVREAGYLRKLIFVAPPKKSRWTVLPRTRTRFDWEAAWPGLTQAFVARNLRLPEYDAHGQAFTFGNDGHIMATTPLCGEFSGFALELYLRDHYMAMTRGRKQEVQAKQGADT